MDVGKITEISATSVEGAWRPAPGLPGVEVKVRPANSPAALRAFRRLARAETARDDEGMLPREVEEAIELNVLLDVILLDWRGLSDGGKKYPYSRENAAGLLGMEMFREAVTLAAEKFALEQAKQILALEKN